MIPACVLGKLSTLRNGVQKKQVSSLTILLATSQNIVVFEVVSSNATFVIDACLFSIFFGTFSFHLLHVEECFVTILFFAGGFGSLITTYFLPIQIMLKTNFNFSSTF